MGCQSCKRKKKNINSNLNNIDLIDKKESKIKFTYMLFIRILLYLILTPFSIIIFLPLSIGFIFYSLFVTIVLNDEVKFDFSPSKLFE
jgi:hypothetical protein